MRERLRPSETLAHGHDLLFTRDSLPHAGGQLQRGTRAASCQECSAGVGRALQRCSLFLAFKTPVPTDLRTRTPARRTHPLEGSRPGSSKLSVCAALSVVDFRISPGRGEACTTRSRPPRGRGASSAAHAEHVLTAKCCVGRSGAGGQRTATQHQTSMARASAVRRASAGPTTWPSLASIRRKSPSAHRQRTWARQHPRERTLSVLGLRRAPRTGKQEKKAFFGRMHAA